MQRRFYTRFLNLALGSTVIVAVACSDAANAAGPIGQPSHQSGSGGNSDTSQSPSQSNGPVASVRVLPQQLQLSVGNYALLSAAAFDANGSLVAKKTITWRSANASIVIASDSGIVYGKAVGTTKVYATIEGHTDSATVTVDSAAPAPTPAPQPVASFNLEVIVVGAVSGSDTSKTEPVPGAVVKLSRIGGVQGDTLSQSVDAGSAVADANGAVSFTSLTGGSYSVSITPPAGSRFAPVTTGFGPPRTDALVMRFKLPPKS
jgi:Bacterial Ig-like domain (group 2).